MVEKETIAALQEAKERAVAACNSDREGFARAWWEHAMGCTLDEYLKMMDDKIRDLSKHGGTSPFR